MSTQKIDQRTARAINSAMILNELRREGPMSRARLAERSGLSAAAISIVASELLEQGLVVPRPDLSDQTSRRSVPLDVNYAGHYAIGMKLNIGSIEVGITDLSLRVLASHVLPLPNGTPRAVVATAEVALEYLMGQVHFEKQRLVGAGMAMAGIIDVTRGVCLHSHRHGWTDVPITSMLEERLGVGAWVDNDLNAFATAERLLGRGKQSNNFMVVTFGSGIGGAFVLDGKLFRGAVGGAGELGHMIVEPGGRLCACGRHGCLEAYVSEPNILAQWQERHPDQTPPEGDALLELVTQRNEGLLELLNETGRRYGRVLANIVTLFNPELMIITGDTVRLGEAVFGPLREELRRNVFGNAQAFTLLVDEQPDPSHTWLRGAAGLAVEQFFTVNPQVKSPMISAADWANRPF